MVRGGFGKEVAARAFVIENYCSRMICALSVGIVYMLIMSFCDASST